MATYRHCDSEFSGRSHYFHTAQSRRRGEELVVLINLEDTNADLIRQEVPKIERLKILREKAYRQLELLRKNQDTIEALKKNLIEDTETNG